MSTLTVDDLKSLTKKLIENPEAVYELSTDELSQVRKYINPYGTVINANESWINVSIINWRDEYMRKFHMTGLVGYLFRTLEEYEDEDDLNAVEKRWDERIRETQKFNRELAEKGVPASELDANLQRVRRDRDEEIKLRKNTVREIARRFLNRNFNFNPDKHVRGTHSSNKKDPERVEKSELLREAMAIADRAELYAEKMQANPEATFTYLKDKLLYTYQKSVEIIEITRGLLKSLQNPELDADDKTGILLKKYEQMTHLARDMKAVVGPFAAAETLHALNVDPPADVFLQYQRYLTNHYEQLRDACLHLFNEKPDLEFSVIYYDSFKNREKARDYRNQHADEFRAEVLTISNNGVSLVGPFKENRERIDFYNKNTEIIKRMMEQMEADHKLGKDLIDKKIRDKKTKNIQRDGPDDPGLASYAKIGVGVGPTVSDLGAKKGMTAEEQKLAVNQKIPEDSIQVDMFYPDVDESGELKIKKTHFYSQAEAPLHLQEGSQFVNKYQPKRNEDETTEDAIVSKKVQDRYGNVVEIKDIVEKTNSDK